MRKVAAFAFLLIVLPLWVVAQIPPVGSLTVGTTSITNGTNGLCLYQATGGKLGEQACGTGTAADIKVGTTTVSSGTTTRILYDNAGTLGEYTLSGSGTVVAMQTAPSFLTSVTMPSVAFASLPAPGTAGKIVRCSNFGTKGAMLMDDGTRWKPLNGSALLSSMDTTSSPIANSATIVHQYQLPTNMLTVGDRLHVRLVMNKSGTTDAGILRLYMGTAGTTGDTQLLTANLLSASNRAGTIDFDFRLESATSLQQVSTNNIPFGYSTLGANASLSPVTITNASSNSLFFSIGILSSSTNDTVTLIDAQIYFVASAN